MSHLNLEWVKTNFSQYPFTFFDVGSADMDDSRRMKELMPLTNVYAFECANHWLDQNIIGSVNAGIHYFHCAVCDIDGTVQIYPSTTQHGIYHPYSSSVFEIEEHAALNSGKKYGDPYSVTSIRLETFCKKFNVTPDFIHIDVEGAEFKVFQNIGSYIPKCVWAEVCTFDHYKTGTSEEEFSTFMKSLGYYIVCHDNGDMLYCQAGFEITPYEIIKE